MQKNLKLIISYDGSAYFGWQKTNAGPSIESILQAALEKIFQAPIVLQAASRTDAGVHAFGQVVNFFTTKDPLHLNKILLALNGLLPRDIVVRHISEENPEFHPTLDSRGKEYRYTICNVPYQMPQHRFYSWHVYEKLNFEDMQHAAQYFLGRHDFSAFCNFKKTSKYKDYNREITGITFFNLETTVQGDKVMQDLSPSTAVSRFNLPDSRFEIHMTGNHFLYKMVRNIVGTLVYVGKGLIHKDAIPQILADQDRKKAGITAPAHGLTLHHVKYVS